MEKAFQKYINYDKNYISTSNLVIDSRPRFLIRMGLFEIAYFFTETGNYYLV